MSDQSASALQFIRGQEICQIALGMYDLQINWGDGGLSCRPMGGAKRLYLFS
jgi:hypothetical protein